MKILSEKNLRDFEAWGWANHTKNLILDAGLEEEFEAIIEECSPEGISDTNLNDLLWFDSEWILKMLGIEEEEEE